MKMIKLISLALVLLAHVALAGGGGSGVGGGGTAFILPDDRVVLADPYLPMEKEPKDSELGKRVTLAPEVIEEMNRIFRIMEVYGGFHGTGRTSYGGYITNEFRTNVVGPEIQYRMVQDISEISQYCPYSYDAPSELSVPQGAKKVALACSRGNMTWLVEPLIRGTFKLENGNLTKPMTVREIALTVLHERLRTTEAFGNALNALSLIGRTTTLIGNALDILNSQLRGERPVLSSSQVRELTELSTLLGQHWVMGDGLSVRETIGYLCVFKNGGGLVVSDSYSQTLRECHQTLSGSSYSPVIQGNAYIGIASTFGNGHYVNPNDERPLRKALKRHPVGIVSPHGTAELIYTGKFCSLAYCTLGDGAKLIDMPDMIYGGRAVGGINSVAHGTAYVRVVVGDQSRLESFKGENISAITLGDRSVLEHADLTLSAKNVNVRTSVNLGNDVVISNLGKSFFKFRSHDLNTVVMAAGTGGATWPLLGMNLSRYSPATTTLGGIGLVGVGALALNGVRYLIGKKPGYQLNFADHFEMKLSPGEVICSGLVANAFDDELGFRANVSTRGDLIGRCMSQRMAKKYSFLAAEIEVFEGTK